MDILELLDSLEPATRAAFIASIQDVKDSAQMAVLINAIKNGNVDHVLAALRLDASFFQPLDDALRAAYLSGGVNALAALPKIPDPSAGGPMRLFFAVSK